MSGNIPNDNVGLSLRTTDATVPFWDDPVQSIDPSNSNLSPWDICYLANIQLPGICLVQAKKKKRLDIKRAKGKQNATITFNGNDPADVLITCRIWTPVQLSLLQALLPVINPPPNAKTFSAVDIAHPALTLLGIGSVVVQFLDALQPTQTKGVWELKIYCIEYAGPTKKDVTKTADGSSNYNTVPHAVQANSLQKPPQPSETDTGP